MEWGESINYGNIFNLSENPILDSTEVQIKAFFTGFTPGKKYHCRIKASNDLGTTYSKDIEFTSLGSLPSATLYYPADIGTTSALINGSVISGFLPTTVVFEWGTTKDYGNIATASPSTVTRYTGSTVNAKLTTLSPGTKYHFRIKATNTLGTITSDDKEFTTRGSAPFVGNSFETDVQLRSVVLKGIVVSHSLKTTAVFEWGKTNALGNKQPATQSPLSGSLSVDTVSALISGLAPGTAYYFQLKAVNELGRDSGHMEVFVTLGSKPTVTAKPVNSLAINSTTLSGKVNPHYLPTTIAFEWGIYNLSGTQYLNSVIPAISPTSSNNDLEISVDLTGLNPETTYSYRIKAENELGSVYSYGENFTTYSLKDADYNYYHAKVIGTQTWITENLKTTRYANGDLIGTTSPATDISTEVAPKYQWPPEGGEENVSVYGRLYTWYTVTDSRKLCPSGWHIPSDAEMMILANHAGGMAVAGKLKEYGTVHWSTPNDGATGAYGFNALPSGNRTISGYLGGLNDLAYFWTSTEYNANEAWKWELTYISPFFTNGKSDKKVGASVRCIKD